MNSQELRALQEAYMDVYSSTEEIDEATATPPSKFNIRRGLDAKSRRLRRSSDFYAYGQDPDPEERKISTSKGEGGITKNPKKLRKQKAMGEIGESYDYYDIILSHLLDEGYAETPEAAEAIMVNMSEDWREEIVEAFPKVPISPDRLNPIDPKTGKSKYKMVTGPDGKPKEIETPNWRKPIKDS